MSESNSLTSNKMPASCSVVVPTYGRPRALEQCLLAVRAQDHTPAEVIVVDNHPADGAAAGIARDFDAIYMAEPVRGLSRARNRAGRAATSEVVAYVDDDGTPDPGWLRSLANEFSDTRVMATAGRTVPLCIDSDAARLSLVVGGPCFDLPNRLDVDRETESWFEICAFGGVGGGGNMAIRRGAFDFWEGFHEGTGRGAAVCGGEEQFAFLMLVDMGYRVTYTPGAVVKHPTPDTMDKLRSSRLRHLSASMAYISLLVAEQPHFRGRTFRYLLGAARGEVRPWRGEAPSTRPRIHPRWREVVALASGPALYAYGRMTRSIDLA